MDLKDIRRLYALFVLGCVFAFELPKMPYIFSSILGGEPYRIFPQYGGPISKSSIMWIWFHYCSSVTFSVILICNILFEPILRNHPRKSELEAVNYISLLAFVVLVIFNPTNLGGLGTVEAIVVNVFMLGLVCGAFLESYFARCLAIVSFPTVIFGTLGLLKCHWSPLVKIVVLLWMAAFPYAGYKFIGKPLVD
jgi:hypothetical protein